MVQPRKSHSTAAQVSGLKRQHYRRSCRLKVRKFFFLFQVFQVCVALADLELMEVEVMELKMCATNKRGGGRDGS